MDNGDKTDINVTEEGTSSVKQNSINPENASSATEDLDPGITKEVINEAKDDLNAVYREGALAAQELKEAFDDIKSAFNFGGLFKK